MTRKYPKKRPGFRPRYPQKKGWGGQWKNLKRFLWFLALVLAAGYYWQTDQPSRKISSRGSPTELPLEVVTAENFIGRVTHVSDGDTLSMSLTESGAEIKIRLYGLDAPELNQPHGKEARDFLSDLLLNREVRVKKQDIDQYGRVVGQIYDSGLFVNMTLVASGHAWVYEQFCHEPICRQMKAEEAKARQKKIGLWNRSAPLPPWQWRHPQRDQNL